MRVPKLFLALSAAGLSHALLIKAVASFPPGTWVENLMPRESGPILVTLASSPQVYQVDPTGATPPTLVATMPKSKACLGIDQFVFNRRTPGTPEKFAVICGNFSLATGDPGYNTFSVWKIDVNGYNPESGPVVPKLVTHVPQAKLLNGLVKTFGDHMVLVADSIGGAVWLINMKNGKKSKVLEDEYMKPTAGAAIPLGVNGLSLFDETLYFTNTNQGIVVQQEINGVDSKAEGTPVVVANVTDPDDFTLYGTEGAYMAGNDSLRIVYFANSTTPSQVEVVSDDPLLKGSTAIKSGGYSASGHYQSFVTTNGGADQYANPPATTGGKVVRVIFND